MNIVGIVDNQFYLSGVNAYWEAMAHSLTAMGHQVHTLVLDDGRTPWNGAYFDALDTRVHRLQDAPSNHGRRAAAALFKKMAPDIICHHYSDRGLDISADLKQEGVGAWKDLYVCHSDDPDHYQRIQCCRQTLSHVLCVSQACRDHVVEQLGFPYDRTSVHHYHFTADSVAGGHWPEQPERDMDRPVRILYAGRLENYQKHAGEMVPLARALEQRKIPFRLDVAGDGRLENQLKEDLAPFRDEGKVIFHGFLEPTDLWRLMGDCDVYISFSRFEGLSTSLVQAMAFGLIPVLTRTQSGSDFLTDGENAFFYTMGRLDQAADCIGRVHNKGDAMRMRQRIRSTVSLRFNIASSVAELSVMVDALTARKGLAVSLR